MGTVFFHVVRRAEAAFQRLPPAHDLLEVVEFFLEHHRPLRPRPMAEAIAEFGEWLRTQRKCEEVTIAGRTGGLAQFARAARVTRSDGIRASAARAWVYDARVAVRTQRDRFDALNWFGKFLVARKLAAKNPVEDFAGDRPVVKVTAPGVFTFDEVWRLLQCALTDAEGPEMLPFFSLCALSGVRPDEIPRLSRGCIDEAGAPDPWGDVHLAEEHRLIEVNQAKGGRKRRAVAIGEPLARILAWCREKKLAPNFFSRRKFTRIRRRAGLLAKWEKDVLRHTFASHHFVVHKDTKQLERDMGNSERVLFQNYIRPVPATDGRRMLGLCLHWSAAREKSAMGSGKKFRKKRATATASAAARPRSAGA